MSVANGLPKGWTTTSIASICDPSRPIAYGVLQPGTDFASGVPFIRVCDVAEGRVATEQLKRIAPAISAAYPRTLLRGGEVLLTVVGTIGRSAVVPELLKGANTARAVAVLPVAAQCDPRFVELTLRLSRTRADLTQRAHEVARKTLNLEDVRVAHIPLAPVNEQRRIVEKIEELFSDLDAGVAALERAKANLKRYRASILKAAVEGKLTAAWRAEHKDVEPTSKLLERILAERRRKWETDQLAKFAAANKPPPKNWRAKYAEPAPPDTTNLPELPKGWCWATVDQLAAHERYSLAIGPFGSNLKVSDYTDSGVPLVFVRNIRSGNFGGNDAKFVAAAKARELDAHSVDGGDILVTKMGDPPGDACLYPLDEPRAIITADCIKFRPCEILNCRHFFVSSINSQVVREQVLGITKGVAQQKVSLARFSSVALPLPPLEEQMRIVDEVGERFSQIEAAEIAIDHGLHRAARLRQSILKRAFEGKLVPQDPRDEPATVLLERIQAGGIKDQSRPDGLRGRAIREPVA